MTQPLVVVGAGGFGRETLDVVDAVKASVARSTFELLGVLDDAPSELNLKRLAARNAAYLGQLDNWLDTASESAYLVAVGNMCARARIAARLDARGHVAAVVVHPSASVGSATTIGAGTVVCAGVEVSTNVVLGRHVHLNPNATIGHDTVIEDFVSVNPAATISGECRIQTGAMVGAGAVILPRLSVGAGATVGAAACVTRDVAQRATVMGVPAR